MRKLKVKINCVRKINQKIFLLGFKSPYLAENSSPGQFLQVKIPSKSVLIRRPFSIHDVVDENIYLLCKVRGRGTKALSCIKEGDSINVIGPLGKGFNYAPDDSGQENAVLIAGGIGVAPLFFLAKEMKLKKRPPWKFFLGARDKSEMMCVEKIKKLGYEVLVSTDDGSLGEKGTVVESIKKELQKTKPKTGFNIYACGPKAMFCEIANLKSVYPFLKAQLSFEQFMGCGVGICSGCVINTKHGYKKVCKDGPVFNMEDIY